MRSTHQISRVDAQQLAVARLRIVRRLAHLGDITAQSEFARRLSRRGKHGDALRWFELAARSGDPECQMELGVVLFWDRHALREGFKWIRRAAEKDHIGAQYFLAVEFATGENVRQNLRAAARWYRRAAMLGHSEAQYNLALMYWAGEGVPRSSAAAHRWLRMAAKSDDLLALQALVNAYECGHFGYRPNAEQARYWRGRYNRVSSDSVG
jgi:uncharacterized protein